MEALQRHGCVALLAVTLALGAGACGSSDSGSTSTKAKAASTDAATPPDQGDMKVVFDTPANQDDADAKDLLTTTGTARTVASLINDTVVLPNDTPVVFTSDDPGGTGPHYDPQAKQINFPYGFVNFIAGTFKQNEPDITDEDLARATDNAVDWILLHEMGHALVDQLDIPVLAKEEDSADNIATVLLSLGGREGGDIALSGAQLFAYLQQDPSQLTDSAFWDEHSLDLQRANQTACLVYGSDPKAFADLEQIIPPERLDRCPNEWQQISTGVEQVLSPYLKS